MGYSYSCVPSALAFEVMWGWRRPCFVTNLTAFYLHIVLFSYKQAREQVHLLVKTGRFAKKKKQGHFQPRPYPKARALGAKLQKWSSEFFTHSGSEEYHPQKLRIFLKRSQNWQNDFENAVLSNLTLSRKTFNKKLGPPVFKETNSKELEKESIHMYLTPIGAWINFLWNWFKNTTFREITSSILRTKFKKSSKITLYLTAKKMG